MSRLSNKVALITGAGRGIGAAIAELFAKEGAIVIATDIKKDGKLPSNCLELNVTQESNWNDTVQYIRGKYGKLDILINNAGTTDDIIGKGRPQNPENFDIECWDAVHEVNVKGAAIGCKKAIELMKNSTSGSIVNVSSISSHATANR